MIANTKTISLKKLKLDLENPRIPVCLTEEDAIGLLCATEQILELARDIAKNGISPCDKLIVLQDGEEYTVAEGNRRLVALMLLNKPKLAPKRFFRKFSQYSTNRKVQINSVECLIVSDRKEAKHWIETKHSGQNKGRGVKPWNAIQKARYFPSNKNRFAYLLFNFLLEDISQVYEITNVTRFISGPTFFEYTGIRYNSSEDELSFSCSYEENSALGNFLKQFVQDILEEKLNSRDYNDKENREKYFETLSQRFGLKKAFVYSKNGSGEGKNKKEIEHSKGQYSLFPDDANKDENYQKSKETFEVYDKKIADRLSKLDAIKYTAIYSSVRKLSTNFDTPLLYIAFSCLFEGLANFLGCPLGKTFDEFLKCRLTESIFDAMPYTEDRRNTIRTLTKIRENANMAKHGKIAAPLNYQELCNHMKVLKPLLIYLIEEVHKENAKEEKVF